MLDTFPDRSVNSPLSCAHSFIRIAKEGAVISGSRASPHKAWHTGEAAERLSPAHVVCERAAACYVLYDLIMCNNKTFVHTGTL